MESVITQDVVSKETKRKHPKDMTDDEIAEYIKQKGTEHFFSDQGQLVYSPTTPYHVGFSYITFTNCTIPHISMCYGTTKISGATFRNVDFGSCVFKNVIFYQCVLDNCNFSNTLILDLTFKLCIIKNTDLNYKNVVVLTINDV